MWQVRGMFDNDNIGGKHSYLLTVEGGWPLKVKGIEFYSEIRKLCGLALVMFSWKMIKFGHFSWRNLLKGYRINIASASS